MPESTDAGGAVAAPDAAAANTSAADMNAVAGNADAAASTTDAGTADAAAAATPPEPWYKKTYDAETGKFTKGYQEHFPAEFEDLKNIAARHDNPMSVLKALKEQTAYASSKGNIKPLTDASTEAEIADYRTKMGIPSEPYKFDKPEKLPDGLAWPEQRAKEFGELAQKENWTPKQAKQAMDLHIKYLSEDYAAAKEATEANDRAALEKEADTLKLMYGGKLDDTVLAAKRAAIWGNVPVELFDPKVPTAFQGPGMLAFAAKVAEMLGEGVLPSVASVSNMDELAQARDIQTNPGNPDHKAFQSGNPDIFKKVQDLVQKGLERRGRSQGAQRGAA